MDNQIIDPNNALLAVNGIIAIINGLIARRTGKIKKEVENGTTDDHRNLRTLVADVERKIDDNTAETRACRRAIVEVYPRLRRLEAQAGIEGEP